MQFRLDSLLPSQFITRLTWPDTANNLRQQLVHIYGVIETTRKAATERALFCVWIMSIANDCHHWFANRVSYKNKRTVSEKFSSFVSNNPNYQNCYLYSSSMRKQGIIHGYLVRMFGWERVSKHTNIAKIPSNCIGISQISLHLYKDKLDR